MKEAPFKSMIYGQVPFNPDKTVFGEKNDKKLPLNLKSTPRSATGFKHEAPFKPNNPPKRGEQGFIGKYPEHKADPLTFPKRKDLPKGQNAFKINNAEIKSRPTPSITLFASNLRREISKSAGRF